MRLIPHAAVFYLGLVITLIPLGIGAGALGAMFAEHRSVLVVATSLVLIVLGAMHALGLGFDLAQVMPGVERAQRAASRGAGLSRTFLLGAVGGVAGFCAGPILGAVLTLAMGQGACCWQRSARLLTAPAWWSPSCFSPQCGGKGSMDELARCCADGRSRFSACACTPRP